MSAPAHKLRILGLRKTYGPVVARAFDIAGADYGRVDFALVGGRVQVYVITGKGYSVVDGERWDWEKGDLVLLPMKPEGVEHRHFNLDPQKPAIWCAFINIPIQEHLASDLKQTENSPDFKEG